MYILWLCVFDLVRIVYYGVYRLCYVHLQRWPEGLRNTSFRKSLRSNGKKKWPKKLKICEVQTIRHSSGPNQHSLVHKVHNYVPHLHRNNPRLTRKRKVRHSLFIEMHPKFCRCFLAYRINKLPVLYFLGCSFCCYY